MKKTIDLRKKIAPIPEADPPKSENFVVRHPKYSIPAPSLLSSPLTHNISWSGQIFYHNPDMKAVWIIAGSLFGLAAIFQIFQKNLITTVFLGLLGLTLILYAKKKTQSSTIEITAFGVKINDRATNYKEIKSFWVDYQPDFQIRELSLQLKKWYMPYLKIQIGSQDPVRLRAFLVQFIPEIEHEETLSDAIARRLGL
ncbi:MAG: hypothetical protein AAB885_02685 [Patescibacteria group bacterium]